MAWLQLQVFSDAYTARRVDPHDSIRKVLTQTRLDIQPLSLALTNHFERNGIGSDAERISFVQGLVQAVPYAKDETTGWTEYPKFGVEFLVDEQGDCDDAAILNTLILEALGYSSYFVNWTGHVSTAVEPDRGDLKDFPLPMSSFWLEGPGRIRLIHVDATGTYGGCGEANVFCGRLGMNRPDPRHQLESVIPSRSPDIERLLPLSAWSNGGRDRPANLLQNRRTLSEQKVREEIVDQTARRERIRQRLQARFGFGEAAIDSYLRPGGLSLAAYRALLGFGSTFLAGVAAIAWRRRQARLRRVGASISRRAGGRF